MTFKVSDIECPMFLDVFNISTRGPKIELCNRYYFSTFHLRMSYASHTCSKTKRNAKPTVVIGREVNTETVQGVTL